MYVNIYLWYNIVNVQNNKITDKHRNTKISF